MTSSVAAKAGGGSGRVGVADAFHHSVHKITPTGTVSTLAGTGSAGSKQVAERHAAAALLAELAP